MWATFPTTTVFWPWTRIWNMTKVAPTEVSPLNRRFPCTLFQNQPRGLQMVYVRKGCHLDFTFYLHLFLELSIWCCSKTCPKRCMRKDGGCQERMSNLKCQSARTPFRHLFIRRSIAHHHMRCDIWNWKGDPVLAFWWKYSCFSVEMILSIKVGLASSRKNWFQRKLSFC